MKYELLGKLRVIDGKDMSFISAQKLETLLAVLLIRADRVVTADQLMAELWGERRPRRATAGLHVYICETRKFLSRPYRRESPIVTRSPGYMLRTGSDEIDYRRFLERAELGRGYLRDQCYEQASACFEDVLGLWRGPMLSGIGNGPIIQSFVTWMTEVQMECAEMLMDSQLLLGRHRAVVGRLRALVAESPLREAFYRQLMLALYRSHRRADALKVYQTAREILISELGLEPCRALQEVHRDILQADDRADSAHVLQLVFSACDRVAGQRGVWQEGSGYTVSPPSRSA